MESTTTSVHPDPPPAEEQLVHDAREHDSDPLDARQRRAELLVGAAFLLAAVLLATFLPGSTEPDAPAAVLLVGAYALATRVRFEIGAGQSDPSVLVLVPMLFTLPAGYVPLLVALGFALGRLPDYLRGTVHPDRALLALGNAWHAVGPALVLAAAGPGDPELADWPLYLAALGAQFACDTASGITREWLTHGMRPEVGLGFLVEVYRLDLAFAPVGLLAAIAMERSPLALALLAPLSYILMALARERATRLGQAFELSETRRRALEAELRTERARVEVFGSISHGLQTPLASVVGLAGTLASHGEVLGPERRATITAQLGRDAKMLRHRVRQILDYQSLQGGGTLRAAIARVDVCGPARDAAQLIGHAEVIGCDAPVYASADAPRVEQVLTALTMNAVAAAGAARLEVGMDGDEVRISVADAGPGVPVEGRGRLFSERAADSGLDESAGTGIGLYVAQAVAASMDGRVEAAFPAEGGSCFTLVLPAAAM